jgi:hypothetical protein
MGKERGRKGGMREDVLGIGLLDAKPGLGRVLASDEH